MTKRRPWYSVLYIQVLIAIAIGIALGYYYPKTGVATIVISRWEGELDADKLHETMAHPLAAGEEMEVVPA